MKKAGIIAVLAALILGLGIFLSAGVLADTIGDDPNQNVDIEPNPPDPGECICPQVYDPVVCLVNGQKQIFSNACFAGCAGATQCRKFAIAPKI